MKLDEFKKIEEEFRLSDIIGDYGSASVRGMGSKSNIARIMDKDAFIKDFIEDALASLDSGIKGGLIDPNLQTKPPAGQQPKPAAAQPTNYSATAKKYNLPTSKFNESYLKLNQIFESIIIEATGGASSISDYLKTRWFPSYMKGVNYTQAKPVIDKTIDQIQLSYTKDKGMAALTNLANLSYTLSKDNIPAGASDVAQQPAQKGTQQTTPQAQQPGQPVAPQAQQPSQQPDLKATADDIKKKIIMMKDSDPNAFLQLLNDIQQIKTAAAKEFVDRQTSKKVAESQKLRKKNLK